MLRRMILTGCIEARSDTVFGPWSVVALGACQVNR
jgi:hypothetical protein